MNLQTTHNESTVRYVGITCVVETASLKMQDSVIRPNNRPVVGIHNHFPSHSMLYNLDSGNIVIKQALAVSLDARTGLFLPVNSAHLRLCQQSHGRM
jgi:hypothetical protein